MESAVGRRGVRLPAERTRLGCGGRGGSGRRGGPDIFHGLRVTLDGVCLDLSEAPAAPYQENGQVMLPLWKVAQALGWTVTWLPEENGTRIENEDQVMNLTYGLDRYACASKSSIGVISPEHYGAAPVVVAGPYLRPRLHVPAALLHRDDGGGPWPCGQRAHHPRRTNRPPAGQWSIRPQPRREQAVGFPLKAPGELGAPERSR